MAFCIPLFKGLIPPLILLLLITSLVNHRYGFAKRPEKRNPKSFWIIAIYAMYAVCLLYTSNMSSGLFTMEINLSLLAFPVIFYVSNLDLKRSMPAVLKAFVEGCLAACAIALINSTYKLGHGGGWSEFFYSKVSPFDHSSYFAMYLCFSLITVYFYSFKPSKNFYLKPWFSFSLLVFFTLVTVLLLSKTGIIAVMLIHVAALSYWIIYHKNYTKGFIGIGVLLVGVIGIYFSSSQMQERIDDVVNSMGTTETAAQTSSTQSRLQAWRISNDLIMDAPILGYGTGDVPDVLTEAYKSKGLAYMAKKQLNAHNQFLQTTLRSGIVGGLILLLMLGIPIYLCIRNRKGHYLFFLALISVNFVTEAMLETQAGVVFFAFFNTLFFYLLMQQLKLKLSLAAQTFH